MIFPSPHQIDRLMQWTQKVFVDAPILTYVDQAMSLIILDSLMLKCYHYHNQVWNDTTSIMHSCTCLCLGPMNWSGILLVRQEYELPWGHPDTKSQDCVCCNIWSCQRCFDQGTGCESYNSFKNFIIEDIMRRSIDFVNWFDALTW